MYTDHNSTKFTGLRIVAFNLNKFGLKTTLNLNLCDTFAAFTDGPRSDIEALFDP